MLEKFAFGIYRTSFLEPCFLGPQIVEEMKKGAQPMQVYDRLLRERRERELIPLQAKWDTQS